MSTTNNTQSNRITNEDVEVVRRACKEITSPISRANTTTAKEIASIDYVEANFIDRYKKEGMKVIIGRMLNRVSWASQWGNSKTYVIEFEKV